MKKEKEKKKKKRKEKKEEKRKEEEEQQLKIKQLYRCHTMDMRKSSLAYWQSGDRQVLCDLRPPNW